MQVDRSEYLQYGTTESLEMDTDPASYSGRPESAISLSLSHRPNVLRVEDILDDYERKGVRCSILSEKVGFRKNMLPREVCELAQKIGCVDGSRSGGEFFWIDVEGALEDDMVPFQETFHIHPTACYDCVSRDIREKWECTSKYLFLVLHEATNSHQFSTWLRMIPLKILVFPGFILTFHDRPIASVDEILGPFDSKTFDVPSADWCMYHLLKEVIRRYEIISRSTMSEIEFIAEIVTAYSSNNADSLESLTRMRRASARISLLSQAIAVKQDLLSSLCTRSKQLISYDVLLYVKSVLDNILRIKFQLQMSRDMLDTTISNWITSLNIEDVRLSQRTNDSVGKLTALTTIMLPLTLIAGLFGMNVFVPGDEEDNLNWFIGICVFMIAFTGLAFLFFKRSNYL